MKNPHIKQAVREGLAKLMSTENISVRHSDKYPTASFDILNRVLYLPNWSNDMSDDLYNYLITHEVGHALYTTAEDLKPFMSDKKLKHIINVIEDVRIEKKMLQKFPGAFRSFRKAYDEMLKPENDFLGIHEHGPVSEMNFLDRANVHFKAGLYADYTVEFDQEESKLIEKIDSCVTMQDVIILAQEFKKFLEDRNEEILNSPQESGEQNSNDEESNASEGSSDGSEEQTPVAKNKSGEKADSYLDTKDDQDNESDNSEPNTDSNKDDLGKASGAEDNKESDPFESKTQSAMAKAMDELIDENIKNEYLIIPKEFDLSQVVIPHDHIHGSIRKFYKHLENEGDTSLRSGIKLYEKFLKNNKPVLSNMISNFEMKKRAKLHSRTKVSRMGALDMNKLHKYRYTDDVFLKRHITPDGKNHGMIVFLDCSSSMSEHYLQSIEQTILLASFCRKVNIPFDVYGFSDENPNYCKGQYDIDYFHYELDRNSSGKSGNDFISFQDRFFLRQYFSSNMSAKEFTMACENLLTVGKYINRYRKCPPWEKLGSTPMDEAILAGITLCNRMKQRHQLDVINAVFITDGSSNGSLCTRRASGNIFIDMGATLNISVEGSPKKYRATKENTEYKHYDLSEKLMYILQDLTGCNTVGFYLGNSWSLSRFAACRTNLKNSSEFFNTINERGFVDVKSVGFDSYYYVSVDSMNTSGNIKREMNGVDNIDELKKIYVKSFKQKTSNRAMLSKFIDNIVE